MQACPPPPQAWRGTAMPRRGLISRSSRTRPGFKFLLAKDTLAAGDCPNEVAVLQFHCVKLAPWRCPMKRLLVPCLLAMLLSGCLSSVMNSWKGKHRDDLVKSWGPPTQEAALADGGKSIVYVTYSGDGSGIGTCRQIFNLDANGIIRSWAYSGCSSTTF